MEEFNEDGIHGENITERVFNAGIIPNKGYRMILVGGNTRSEVSASATSNSITGDGKFYYEMFLEAKNSNRISVKSFEMFKGNFFLFNTYTSGKVFALRNTPMLHNFVRKYIGKLGVYRIEMPTSKQEGYIFIPGELRSAQYDIPGIDLCDELITEDVITEFDRIKREYRAEMETKK